MKIFLKIIFTFIFLVLIIRYFPIPTYKNPYDIQDEITVIKQPLEEKILSLMTLDEKVGQLFIFGINGTEIIQSTTDLIENKHIGGVLLLGKNISNPTQLAFLNEELQNLSKLPLIISIDQEGGTVARLRWDRVLTTPPKSMGDEKNIYDIAVKRSLLLEEYGINMNLAPVVEYITNPNSFLYPRVFSGTKQEVASKSYYAMKGYADAGIISVAKHYPGHNDSSVDSHYNLPKVNIYLEQWSEYVSPFSYLIQKECVDVIMVGHVLFPNIDSKPSTISEIIINRKLREEMGYDGVIITDDMQMGAIEKQGDFCDIAIEALQAGNDMLMYSLYYERPNTPSEVYKCILDAVEKEVIKEEYLNEKVKRVLNLKIKYGLINESTLQFLTSSSEKPQ